MPPEASAGVSGATGEVEDKTGIVRHQLIRNLMVADFVVDMSFFERNAITRLSQVSANSPVIATANNISSTYEIRTQSHS
jgi:ribosomal protein L5